MFVITGKTYATVSGAASPVSVADLVAHLSLPPDDYDSGLLQGFLDAAIGAVESDVGVSLTPRTATFTFAGEGCAATLPVSPVTADGQVYFRSSSKDDWQPIDATWNRASLWPTVKLAQALPAGSEVKVVASVGYASGACPRELQVAVRMIAADLFEHRESQTDANTYANPAIDRLLKQWRRPEFA